MRGQMLQPFFVVLQQTGLVVVDKNGSGDVHGIDKDKALPNTALVNALFHLRGDVHKTPARRDLKPELFAIAFHTEVLLLRSDPLIDIRFQYVERQGAVVQNRVVKGPQIELGAELLARAFAQTKNRHFT